jgi:multidrug efflux pump subunit AcrA (membrane-fusion protein)
VHGREKQIETMPEYAGVPVEEQSATALADALKRGMDRNEVRRKYSEAAGEWADEIRDATTEILDLEDKLAKAKERLAKAEAEHPKVLKHLEEMPVIDLAPLRAALDDLDAVNKKVRANKQRAALVQQFQADHERYAELGEALKAIDAEKQARLAAAKAPAEGLEFRDDGVYFQGLPLNQESGSGQMIRAVELVAALNPKLRVMVIDDGERLMLPRLAELDAWAVKNDYQVFVLRASIGQECEFVMVDGHVGTAAEVEEARKVQGPKRKGRKAAAEIEGMEKGE